MGHGAELARLDAQGRALRSLLHHRESEPAHPPNKRALRGPVIARWTNGARAAGLLFGVLLRNPTPCDWRRPTAAKLFWPERAAPRVSSWGPSKIARLSAACAAGKDIQEIVASLLIAVPVGHRIQLAMRLLEAFAILTLPARQGPGRTPRAGSAQRAPGPGRRPPLASGWSPTAPSSSSPAIRWATASRCSHLRYFLHDRETSPPATCRCATAGGWQDQPHRPLERVVRQARFLLFPWVGVHRPWG